MPSTVSGLGESTLRIAVCHSGEVLQGLIKPNECAAFGTQCTPRNPLGATMVSSEGAVRCVLPLPPADGRRRPNGGASIG